MSHRHWLIIAAVLLVVIAALTALRRANAPGTSRTAAPPPTGFLEDGDDTAPRRSPRTAPRVERLESGSDGRSSSRGTTPRSADGRPTLGAVPQIRAGETTSPPIAAQPEVTSDVLALLAAKEIERSGYKPDPTLPEEQQEALVRYLVSRTRNDMRSAATAIESYYVDHNAYPVSTAEPGEGQMTAATTDGRPVPAFQQRGNTTLATLTTPVAYLTSHFHDPFSADPASSFGYLSKDEGGASGWMLISPGPDGKFDLDWELYSPLVGQPSEDLILQTYDPSNGLLSGGDLIRVKQ